MSRSTWEQLLSEDLLMLHEDRVDLRDAVGNRERDDLEERKERHDLHGEVSGLTTAATYRGRYEACTIQGCTIANSSTTAAAKKTALFAELRPALATRRRKGGPEVLERWRREVPGVVKHRWDFGTLWETGQSVRPLIGLRW